ncbi:MAG: 4Fe-4S binding protein [Coriobacteriaceae bacterium]|jgi:ferredoxin|nr:4Fe-4S binding protein [Coriobacteriaceae bacterium]
MPSIIDIVDLAEALESKAVYVAANRCVVVRNRNVRCRKCQEACPTEAFTIEGNSLELNNKACVACGACTVVCPTEALIPLRPLDEELAQSFAAACGKDEGRVVIACARIAAKRRADPQRFVEVPCLARLEENLLIALAAQGISRIVAVDGTCDTCRFRACIPGIEATATSVNTLLEAFGSPARLERDQAFPEDMVLKDTSGLYGVSRRDFFSQTRGRAKDAAGKTVVNILKKNQEEKTLSLRERLGISAEGTLPRFNASRRMGILDSLDQVGLPRIAGCETRLWGNPAIDTAVCNACGMCSVFCPTGALKLVEEGTEEAKKNARRKNHVSGGIHASRKDDGTYKAYLEFSMAECVQCGTCSDVCLKHCLELGTRITFAELLDFEPHVIKLLPPAAPPDPVSGLK